MLGFSKLSIRGLAAVLGTVMLAACASPGDATGHTTHHPGQPASSPAQPGSGTSQSAQPAGGTMGGQPGAGMVGEASADQMKPQGMEMDKMCAMQRNMQNMPVEQRQDHDGPAYERHVAGDAPATCGNDAAAL